MNMNTEKTMTVKGVTITAEQIKAGEKRMTQEPFYFLNVEYALIHAGVPSENAVAYRAADRLLQIARKAGLIEYKNKMWHPVKTA
jgi:hypothetical protein